MNEKDERNDVLEKKNEAPAVETAPAVADDTEDTSVIRAQEETSSLQDFVGTAMFGYNKKAVDEYVDNLRNLSKKKETSYEEKIAGLKAELAKAKDGLLTMTNRYNTVVADKEKTINAVTNENDRLSKENTSMKSELSEKRERITSLEGTLDKLSQSVSGDVENENKLLKDRALKIEESMKKLKADNQALISDNRKKDANISSLEKDLSETREALEDRKTANIALQNRINSLLDTVDKKDSDIKDYDEELSNMKARETLNGRTLKKLRSYNSALMQKISDLYGVEYEILYGKFDESKVPEAPAEKDDPFEKVSGDKHDEQGTN